jgi:hypothetical protein
MRRIQVLVLTLLLLTSTYAQTTAFSYQGKLTDGGNPASGVFQMQFKLYDSLGGSGQVGPTLSDIPVTVTSGVFSVRLDFGSNPLNGANRWLEIAVRHPSSEFYTTLSPREQIASSPYAVQTLNAQMLGGIPASEYVTTSSVGSSFIRNQSTLQAATFNISGKGIFGGGVGIGTSSPLELIHIKSQPGFNAAAAVEAPTGFFAQYQLYTGADNPWIIGTQDNFANGALLFRKTGTDVMAIRQTGNVGIGTSSPVGKLHIEGTGPTGLSLLTTGPVSLGGNIMQPRDKGGAPKAMLYVNGNATIIRCYNGVTGSATGNCGFSVGHLIPQGSYFVELGFTVSDRFVSATVVDSPPSDEGPNAGVSIRFPSTTNTAIVVNTYQVGAGGSDRPFMVFVY